jgi:hypothetical protein
MRFGLYRIKAKSHTYFIILFTIGGKCGHLLYKLSILIFVISKLKGDN